MAGRLSDFLSFVFSENRNQTKYRARLRAHHFLRKNGGDYQKARCEVKAGLYRFLSFKHLILQQLAFIHLRRLRKAGKYPPARLPDGRVVTSSAPPGTIPPGETRSRKLPAYVPPPDFVYMV